MPKEVRLPRLGKSMEEGTIVSIMTDPGDKVDIGDVILQIETDKASLEIESTQSGFVKQIFVELGQIVPVEAVLLVLGEQDEQVPQSYIDSLNIAVNSQIDPASEIPPAAGEQIVDTKQPAAGGYMLGKTIPLSRVQKVTAQKMLQSKQNIPCFYLNTKVDVTELIETRQNLNADSKVKVSINDLIIKAVALALQKYPVMTGRLAGDVIELPENINIAFAVSIDDGLASPVIKTPAGKTLFEIAAQTQDLVERAKQNKLTLDDLEGACITLSNLGAFGVDSFIPIVVPGQCSILGIGRINETYVPQRDGAEIRKIMNLNISVDHKVANGAEAAQFLEHTKKLLEHASTFQPEK